MSMIYLILIEFTARAQCSSLNINLNNYLIMKCVLIKCN